MPVVKGKKCTKGLRWGHHWLKLADLNRSGVRLTSRLCLEHRKRSPFKSLTEYLPAASPQVSHFIHTQRAVSQSRKHSWFVLRLKTQQTVTESSLSSVPTSRPRLWRLWILQQWMTPHFSRDVHPSWQRVFVGAQRGPSVLQKGGGGYDLWWF